ncbi:putative ribonuclease H-like domain-containing protein [Tanacetum coccineum]
MNYKPVVAGNQTNGNAGIKENIDAGQARKKIVPEQEYILLPLLTSDPSLFKSSKDSPDAGFKPSGEEEKIDSEHQENEDSEVPNTQEPRVNQDSADIENNVVDENIVYGCIDDPNMPNLEEIVFSDDDEEVGVEADMNNLATNVPVSPIPIIRVHKDHPLEQIIGYIHSAPQTRRMTKNVTEHVEPKKVIQALTDPSWIEAMQDELLQFKLQKVSKNKKDDRVIVVRNKARLVEKGYTQEEGIDYDEVFAPVARIEAIRLFFAYASFMGFIVYQMDVKSAFLYGTIEEEVYVYQPPSFEDPQFPDKVYKVEKVLYDLHQAPRAWYETLSTYLLENGFRRGIIDKTVFIKKDKDDILLVQVYVDDIIFGSTKKSLCVEYEQMMHKRFQMSSMGELTFFLRLQTASTPIETNKALLKDEEAEDVDVHLHRSMIGSLMYLTASRPDIMFVVYACARFQVTPKVSHLHAVKRIFRYLKGQPKLGLWYPRDSPFDLEAFSDSDYAGASLDRKSTTGGCQFLGKRLISWQCKKQTIVANSTTKAEYVAAANCCGQVLWVQNQMLDYGFNFMNTKIYIDNESTIYETIIKEWEDRMERAATTTSSLEAEQDSGNINRTQSMATLNESFPQETDSGSGPRFFWKGYTLFHNAVQATEDMVADSATPTDSHSTPIITQPSSLKPQKKKSKRKQRKDSAPTEPTTEETIPKEHVSTSSYDPPLSGEDRMQLAELMSLCTNIQGKVLDLEKAKTTQAKEITSLKKRVKQLEKIRKSRTSGLRRLRKVGSSSRVKSSNNASLGAHGGRMHTKQDELTLSQTLIEIKTAKPKPITTVATIVTSVKPRAKEIIFHDQEEQPEVPLKKKDQVALDEEMARNLRALLQPKLIKEERLARQKEEEANITLIKSWDNTQAMMEAGDELEFDKSKKQKIEEHVKAEKDDDLEEEEMKKHMGEISRLKGIIVIDAIKPLATKLQWIVEKDSLLITTAWKDNAFRDENKYNQKKSDKGD